VAFPVTIGTFLARVERASVRVVGATIGSHSISVDLGKVGIRVTVKLRNAMMFLGDDLVDDPFAGHFGRIAACEDGSECGIQVGKAIDHELPSSDPKLVGDPPGDVEVHLAGRDPRT